MMSWHRAENVLCIRLDGIGDVLLCTPAMRALKESGARRITLLTSPSAAQLDGLIPEAAQVLAYRAPWMKATPSSPDPSRDRDLITDLAARDFDGAVIFTSYTQASLPAAMLCYLAGIPLRIAHSRFKPYHLLTDWVPESEPEMGVRHEVRRQLDLVGTIGAITSTERLSMKVRQEDHERIDCLVAPMGVRDRWAIIHPGATAPSRRYPSDGFAQAARQLVTKLDCQVVFTGLEAELPLVEEIRRAMRAPSHSLAGQLTLGELAALIRLAPVVVSGNTAPVHIAAALGTPVVDLYALTNPQHTPWMVPHRLLFHWVPCLDCQSSICPQGHHRCLAMVSPTEVAEAAVSLLEDPDDPDPTGLAWERPGRRDRGTGREELATFVGEHRGRGRRESFSPGVSTPQVWDGG